MHQRTRQRGLSMLGFLFVAIVVVACVMLGFRVTPAYIEWYSVTKGLQDSLAETRDLSSAKEIRAAFQKHADAGYIDSVSGKDIDVTKDKNTVTASASWTRKLHLFANWSLVIEFEASATR
jgi:hypothetical protein